MAFDLHRDEFPAIAGPTALINAGQAVKLDTGDVSRQVLPVASLNDEIFGVALATGASGAAVAVLEEQSVIRVVAGASLGHGANVGVASTNGALGPVSGASGSVVNVVGKAVSAAAAGETFSLYIRPRQLSGLV